MNRSVILVLAMLGGVSVLLAMLLHGSKPFGAANVGRISPRCLANDEPQDAPFLAHLATLGVLDESWEGGESEPVRLSETEAALLIPLFDVAMDWSIPQWEWEPKLRTLFDARLIEGLRDDEVRWNATAAAGILRDRLRSEPFAAETRQALELALEARDVNEQEQRLCAGLLQVHSLRGQDHDPHEALDSLLGYTVNSLDCWANWRSEGRIASSPSGRQALTFLLAHSDRAAARIAQALRERGSENSFAHAFLLGKGGLAEYAHLSAPILVDHLRDNHQAEDALMSLEALRALGEKASPWLWSTLRRSDLQQEYCIRLLLEEAGTLKMNPESVAAQEEKLTWKVENPVRSWHFLDHSTR